MKIEYLKVLDITPYEHNTKVHSRRQIDNVKESIRRFGFVQPVVVDADNVIVIGHCRVLARAELGMTEVPCVKVDDLSEEEVRLLRIADNKTNESPWDFDELSFELGDLDLEGFDFDFEFGGDTTGDDSFLKDQQKVDFDDVKDKSSAKLHTCPNCGFEFEE